MSPTLSRTLTPTPIPALTRTLTPTSTPTLTLTLTFHTLPLHPHPHHSPFSLTLTAHRSPLTSHLSPSPEEYLRMVDEVQAEAEARRARSVSKPM